MKRAILLLTVLVALVLSGCDADADYELPYDEHVILYSGTEVVREWRYVCATSSRCLIHVSSQNGDDTWIQGTVIIEKEKE